MMTIGSRECLALIVARKLRHEDVLAALAEMFVTRGPPEHFRSDNDPEFIAIAVQEWLGRIGVKTLYIAPGSPWENDYNESFNGSLRDELLVRFAYGQALLARREYGKALAATNAALELNPTLAVAIAGKATRSPMRAASPKRSLLREGHRTQAA